MSFETFEETYSLVGIEVDSVDSAGRMKAHWLWGWLSSDITLSSDLSVNAVALVGEDGAGDDDALQTDSAARVALYVYVCVWVWFTGELTPRTQQARSRHCIDIPLSLLSLYYIHTSLPFIPPNCVDCCWTTPKLIGLHTRRCAPPRDIMADKIDFHYREDDQMKCTWNTRG